MVRKNITQERNHVSEIHGKKHAPKEEAGEQRRS